MSSRFIIVRGSDETQALAEASTKLGLPRQDLQAEQFGAHQYKVTILRGPAEFMLNVSPDKFRCVLRRVTKPVGEGYQLSVEECLNQLRKRGVIFGIDTAKIEKIVREISKTSDDVMAVDVNEVIAEGKLPTEGVSEQIRYFFRLEGVELEGGGKKEVCLKGDLLAELSPGRPGVEGIDISGNEIKPPEPERVLIEMGPNVKEETGADGMRRFHATAYGAIQMSGKKLSVVPQTLVEVEGSEGKIDIYPTTLYGRPLTYDDLIEALKTEGVIHGFKAKEEIDLLLRKAAVEGRVIENVVIAEWTPPVHGTKQKVFELYRNYNPADPIDRQRAEAGVVVPGQVILSLKWPEGKREGMTIFGKKLRARDGEMVELFAGKNVKKQTVGDEIHFVAEMYGKVAPDDVRVHVRNIAKIQKSAMRAAMDIYPLPSLTVKQLIYAVKDAEIAEGVDEAELTELLEKAKRENTVLREAVVAKGMPYREGVSAKLRHYFDPNLYLNKDYQKGKLKPHVCIPGEWLLQKFPLRHAEEGRNIFREKIEIPPDKEAKDIRITAGEFVEHKRKRRKWQRRRKSNAT